MAVPSNFENFFAGCFRRVSVDVRFGPDYVCLALNSGRSGGIAEGPFLDPKETFGSFWQPRFTYAVVGSGATRGLEGQTNLDGKFATMRA